MPRHGTIDYAEFGSRDPAASRAFFEAVFGWAFTDYGPDYTAFASAGAGLDGGFFRAGATSSTATGGALLVLFSERLAETQARVEAAGGEVVKPAFAFPGGWRFHFLEPGGNELAVWSDRPPA
jgi:uncharacterized protein